MATMKSVRIHSFGGPDVLSVDSVPRPEPHKDEVVVKVHASSVNPVDYKIRSGGYGGEKGRMPISLGRDLSGTVVVCGARVHMAEGDNVYAMLGRDRGGHSEYAVVKVSELAAKPDGLDHVHAAAVPLAGLTAWQGLFDHGNLKAGQQVLIHGGGGVGHMAIQLAKAKGAIVVTTVSGDDLDFVLSLGADQAVDYKIERFEDVVEPVDVVFDLIGGETQDRSWSVLKAGGRLVSTLTEPSQEKARAAGVRGVHYMAQPNADQLAEIGRLIEEGNVRPYVDTTYRMEDVAAAEDLLENGHVRGKVVLEIAA